MADGARLSLRRYFDFNAGAPMAAEALSVMRTHGEAFGNASSPHAYGRLRRRVIDDARGIFADGFGVTPRDVIFTSSATEANNLALLGFRASGMIVSAVEHDSVFVPGTRRGAKVIGVDGDGQFALDALQEAMADMEAGFLVSLMAANNETGVVWDIGALGECVHGAGGFLHVDGVQLLGRAGFDAFRGADMISLSSHKIGGALGAGALVLCNGDEEFLARFEGILFGGGQEYGLRAGTENVASIAAFARAFHACAAEIKRQASYGVLRDGFEADLRAFFGTRIHFWGADAKRLANTSCFSIEAWRSEEALIALDVEGFAVSNGSACSSGHLKASRVIAAMGGGDAAHNVLRVSFGNGHRKEDSAALGRAIKVLAPPCKEDASCHIIKV